MKKRHKNQSLLKVLISIVAAVLIYLLIVILVEKKILNRQYSSMIVLVGMNVILAVSLNITTGFLGELSLGHAGFMAIGAYTSALITTTADHLPGWIAMLLALVAGGALAALFGILIGMPVLRLRGDYLAIVTLAFNQIICSIINALPFTGGPAGIKKIPVYTNYTNVYLLVLFTILVAANLKKSRHGRAIIAIRENYIAAEATGIPVTKFKIMAFTIAAFFAGIAGVLYAQNYRIIKPDSFDYNKSIDILVYVVLGGMGSIKGSVIAAIVLTLLPEILRPVGDFRKITYAAALIVIMIVNAGDIREKLAKLLPDKKQAKKGEN